MSHEILELPADPAQAAHLLRAASRVRPVLVFKKSPTCPISAAAEAECERFLAELPAGARLAVAWIDVIGERPLARGLTEELGIRHESPQALWFDGGALRWHASHHALTAAAFAALVGRRWPDGAPA